LARWRSGIELGNCNASRPEGQQTNELFDVTASLIGRGDVLKHNKAHYAVKAIVRQGSKIGAVVDLEHAVVRLSGYGASLGDHPIGDVESKATLEMRCQGVGEAADPAPEVKRVLHSLGV
jgi:hypothetical protein